MENFFHSGQVRLQYLESGKEREQNLPLLIIPGATENAADYFSFLNTLQRRVIVLTMRGRFPSDAPADGYTVIDHAQDIEALVRHLSLERFALCAFSRGVSYALAYAVDHPESLEALLLVDYPPRHTALPPDWTERAWADRWRGKTTPERMPRIALEGIQRDAEARSFADELQKISCRILVLGGNPDLGCLLDRQGEQLYLARLQNAIVHRRPGSGHDVRVPDEEGVIQQIESFLG